MPIVICNKLAHNLAQLAKNDSQKHVIMENVPPQLHNIASSNV
jgi:hypothetical protein